MRPFDIIFPFILKHEGGKSFDKNDLGGNTYRGITQRTYDNQIQEIRKMKIKQEYNPIEKDVQNLTDKEVKEFYYYQFQRYKAHLVKNPNTCYVFFDSIINLGPGQATKILQKACNLQIDGIFGQKTEAAVNSLNQRDLQLKMLYYRSQYYKECKTYQFHKNGWNKRLSTIQQQTEKDIMNENWNKTFI